jgi:hypothetical protein
MRFKSTFRSLFSPSNFLFNPHQRTISGPIGTVRKSCLGLLLLLYACANLNSSFAQNSSLQANQVVVVMLNPAEVVPAEIIVTLQNDGMRDTLTLTGRDTLSQLPVFVDREPAVVEVNCFYPDVKLVFRDHTYIISTHCGIIQKYKNRAPFHSAFKPITNDFIFTPSLIGYFTRLKKKFPLNPYKDFFKQAKQPSALETYLKGGKNLPQGSKSLTPISVESTDRASNWNPQRTLPAPPKAIPLTVSPPQQAIRQSTPAQTTRPSQQKAQSSATPATATPATASKAPTVPPKQPAAPPSTPKPEQPIASATATNVATIEKTKKSSVDKADLTTVEKSKNPIITEPDILAFPTMLTQVGQVFTDSDSVHTLYQDPTDLSRPLPFYQQVISSQPILHVGPYALQMRMATPSREIKTGDQVLYQYYLAGLDKAWSDWSAKNATTYLDIPAGSFHFHARSKIVDGEGNSRVGNVTQFNFTVLSNWYMPHGSAPLAAVITKVSLRASAEDTIVYNANHLPIEKAINQPLNLAIAPDWSAIRVEFAATATSPAIPMQYQYKISELSPEWSNWSNQPYIELEGVPSGNYQVAVRAQNEAGDMTQPSYLSLTIEPPFHETPLFYGGLAVGFLALLGVSTDRRKMKWNHFIFRIGLFVALIAALHGLPTSIGGSTYWLPTAIKIMVSLILAYLLLFFPAQKLLHRLVRLEKKKTSFAA